MTASTSILAPRNPPSCRRRLRYTVPAMAIRPLPGELLEHLPRGIDQSQISHHVPLRGGPDGLLGETHLLLFHGELIVLTRGSARAAYRRLDLDPDERAMLLAESWSVQLSLPTRGAPTCFEVSSKDVATVLALISAVKPGQHNPEVDEALDETSEVDEAPAAATQPAATQPAATQPERPPVEATPQEAPRARESAKPAKPAELHAPAAARAPQTPVAPEPWRPTTNLRDAFAASEEAERHAAAIAGEARGFAAAEEVEPGDSFDDGSGPEADDPLDDLNIDISGAETPRPGPIASSVRDIAASFRGAAASLRSAASSLRRGRDEPELGDLPPVDFDDAAPTSDEESLAIDIDDAFDGAFADVDPPEVPEAPAPTAKLKPAAVIPPAASVAKPQTSPTPAAPGPKAPVVSQPLRPAATARVTTPEPRSVGPARAAIRFNFDDLPSPEAVGDGTAAHPGEDVSLAEFFDRHVPPTSDDAPARRRRRMVPEASARRAAPRIEAEEVAPRPPHGPTGTPVAPVAPPVTRLSPPTPVAPAPTPAPTARTSPPKPAPVLASAQVLDEGLDEDPIDPIEVPTQRSKPRPNRRLDPRWSQGARRSATAAASAASTAATVTATAASAAVGRARVAANRLLDRRRTRSGRPRVNRRRLGDSGGRPTMAIAAALMTVAVLIYWALPGDVASVDTAASASESGGLTAPLAEMASEIKASQASMVPAAIGSEAPLPGGGEQADEADAEAEAEPAVAADRDFYGVATLTPESPQPELLALKECRPLAERGLLVRVKVEIDEPTGTVPEVWVGDSSMDRSLRQCVNRQFKKATFVPKERGKLIKQRLKLHF